MSSEESRLEIGEVVIRRMYRDLCVDNALKANVIDVERADSLKRSDDLPQVLDALTDDLLAYGRANSLTKEQFVTLAAVVMPDSLGSD